MLRSLLVKFINMAFVYPDFEQFLHNINMQETSADVDATQVSIQQAVKYCIDHPKDTAPGEDLIRMKYMAAFLVDTGFYWNNSVGRERNHGGTGAVSDIWDNTFFPWLLTYYPEKGAQYGADYKSYSDSVRRNIVNARLAIFLAPYNLLAPIVSSVSGVNVPKINTSVAPISTVVAGSTADIPSGVSATSSELGGLFNNAQLKLTEKGFFGIEWLYWLIGGVLGGLYLVTGKRKK